MRLKNRFKKVYGYFLLILFLGYYGSITQLPHYHIVDGVTIVHSHPFPHGSGTNPVEHQHSGNGFVLIQLISNLIAIPPLLFYGVKIIRRIVNNLVFITDENVPANFTSQYTYLLRAPPLNLHN